MVVESQNRQAEDGRNVFSTVELLIPADTERFLAKPWRVMAGVNGSTLFHSHHATRHDATEKAAKIVDAYLTGS